MCIKVLSLIFLFVSWVLYHVGRGELLLREDAWKLEQEKAKKESGVEQGLLGSESELTS